LPLLSTPKPFDSESSDERSQTVTTRGAFPLFGTSRMTRKSRPGEGRDLKVRQRPPPQPNVRGAPNRASGPVFRRASAELVVLYGFHAVREALRNKQRKLLAVFATPAAAARLEQDCVAAGLTAHIVSPEELTRRLGPDAVHQGVLLEARPLAALALDEIASKSGIVLVLDQITDPHNVGAISRSAAAYGVDAVVTTERHAPAFSGVLAKAASGGLEHVPIIEVVNLARALEELKDLGYLRVGLDSDAPLPLAEAPLVRPLALVLGGEGKGLRRLSRENCDLMVRLEMPGAIKSLNVSTACAVALTIARTKLEESARK
jgi:23S rRNA (guanosine2251-2'-O)-methyltransferase